MIAKTTTITFSDEEQESLDLYGRIVLKQKNPKTPEVLSAIIANLRFKELSASDAASPSMETSENSRTAGISQGASKGGAG